jgi:hypothetical protein
MKRPWDAIAWWEIRRIPFNLFILLIGFVSAFITAFVGSRVFKPDQDIGSPFIEAALYLVAANFCYTFGWVTELLWDWGNTALTETIRSKVFRVGLIFSASLTLLPAIILSLIWAVRRFP